MRYRYGIYAMIVLAVGTALLLFSDLDFGLTVINLIVWPIVIIVAAVIALRRPRYRRKGGSGRRQMSARRISALGPPTRSLTEHADGPALIEYSNGSV